MTMYDRIKSVMDRYINSGAETGAAAVIMKDGKTAAEYACGYADAENKVPFDVNTICRAFSCSKVVTGTAAMQLLERGRIHLDDPLEWYIPEFSQAHYVRGGERINVSRQIVLRDLLNMTSGIAYPGAPQEGADGMNKVWGDLEKSYTDGRQMSTMEFAKRAGSCALMHDTGEHWMYGSSADIFAAVIEAVTGKKFGEYLRENIFEPLGMSDTAFYVPKDKLDRFAVFYDGAGENRRKLGWVNLCIYDYTDDPDFQSGGAGVFTTAADYAKFGAALSNGEYGGVKILGRKTIDFMRRNALTPEQRSGYDWESCRGYGYGNFVRTLEDPNKAGIIATPGSFGWDGWSGTYILNDPAERMSVIVFLQRAGAGTTSLAKAVVNAAYSSL